MLYDLHAELVLTNLVLFVKEVGHSESAGAGRAEALDHSV